MSLSTGLLAIKGQYSDKLPEIFNFFKLVDTGNDTTLTNWNEAVEIIDDEYMNPSDNSPRRVVWFDNGWTIIEDLSLMLCTDEESLIKISQHFSTPVFSLATQGTSGCYAFWYFDKEKIRSFFNNSGEVTDDFGEALPQEANYNINENAFYDDIHGVAKQFGIDWTNAETKTNFIVKKLDHSDELNEEIEKIASNYKQQKADKITSKPWWKFW